MNNHAQQTFHCCGTVAKVSQAVEDWVGKQNRWKVVSIDQQPGRAKIHLTRTTPLMRFTDDIRLVIQPHRSGVQIQSESQSRVGKGDLGQNPRNLKELSHAWQRLPPSDAG